MMILVYSKVYYYHTTATNRNQTTITFLQYEKMMMMAKKECIRFGCYKVLDGGGKGALKVILRQISREITTDQDRLAANIGG